MNVFTQASKSKYRFPSSVGQLSTEDLWDLPLTSVKGDSINSLGVAVKKGLSSLNSDDVFVSPNPTSNVLKKELENKLEILKFIMESKQEENSAVLEAKKKAEHKKALLNALANKQDEEISKLSVEQLKDQLASL